MTKKFFLNFTTIILISFFILTGCTLIHKLEEQKKSPLVKPNGSDSGQNQETKKEDTVEALSIKEKLAVQSQVKKFTGLDELKKFLSENTTVNDYYAYNSGIKSISDTGALTPTARGGMEESLGMAAETESSQKLSSDVTSTNQVDRDYSKTNIQVEGVDEADIIKSDGTYIYALSRNNLFIIKGYPASSSEIVSKIEFKSRPENIYISQDRLVVYGQDNEIYAAPFYQEFRRRNTYTFLKVFDTTDKKNPKQLKDLDFEGSYNNSRMIGDYVYFVTTYYNFYYFDNEPLLPRILDDGEALVNTCTDNLKVKCFQPEVYYFNIPYNAYNFTTITAVNVKNTEEDPTGDVYIMSASQNMYVSPSNIYITYTKYISEYELETEAMKELIYPRLTKDDQGKIDKILAVENYILSPTEKNEKTSQIIARFGQSLSIEEQTKIEEELKNKIKEKYKNISEELEKTVIHKISIDKNKLEYKNFGEVTGQVLNQFSMDESNGYFRIATTKSQTWSKYEDGQIKSYSNLFVLDGDMKIVGSLKGLAEGERIYSVRFMQNRAYLVTFEQTDPLFVIDLADSKNPTVLGQLKIPGFSNYLHPFDDSTLIGIGKDTKENEWGGITTKGIKLSLFDVAQVANPKEIDTYVLGDAGSDSIALADHKAFLFSKDKNLLVIPVSILGSSGRYELSKLSFGGAVVFEINKNGFKLKGKIDHSDSGKPSPVDYWNGYNYYDNTVKRSLYIENVLYTFSNNYLKMNNLSDLSLVKNLKLVKENSSLDDDFNIIN